MSLLSDLYDEVKQQADERNLEILSATIAIGSGRICKRQKLLYLIFLTLKDMNEGVEYMYGCPERKLKNLYRKLSYRTACGKCYYCRLKR